MKKYTDGKIVIKLTDKVYNTLYKEKGFVEIIASKYNDDELENLSYEEIKEIYRANLSLYVGEKISKEEMINGLELIDLQLK